MTRREFNRLAFAAAVSIPFGRMALAADAPERGRKPNILFIMTDQQSAHMMSCAGNQWLKTPSLDGLSASGIRFERAYATNPVCVPSRFSLQTGRMPSELGFGCNEDSNQAKVTDSVIRQSLGTILKNGGYETVYGGKVHLPNKMNNLELLGYRNLTNDDRQGLADQCAKFIKGKHDKPFFLFASFINPHDICFAAINDALRASGKAGFSGNDCEQMVGQARKKSTGDLTPLPANHAVAEQEPQAITDKYLETISGGVKYRKYARDVWQEKDWRVYRDAYRRLTEKVDNEIGQVLRALNESGLEENTLIVFTSDHGDMDGAHKLQHKSLPYEESARIPFIMSCKGKIRPGVVDTRHLVSNGLDLLPTLCDCAEIKTPENLAGASIRPIAEKKPVNNWRAYVVSESEHCRMPRTDRFKYVVYDSGKYREQLINLENDPGEMTNLAGEKDYKAILVKHRQLLKEWVGKSHDAIGSAYARVE